MTLSFSSVFGCSKFEKEKYVYEDNSRAVLAVATAAFILSFSTNQNFKVLWQVKLHVLLVFLMFKYLLSKLFAVLIFFLSLQECTSFLKELVSAKWVQAKRLQSLYASLHNVGIVLHKANRLKEVSYIYRCILDITTIYNWSSCAHYILFWVMMHCVCRQQNHLTCLAMRHGNV